MHGKVGSQSIAMVDAECKQMWEICLLFATCDIYNLNEMGLFWGQAINLTHLESHTQTFLSFRMTPDCSLTKDRTSGVKGVKSCLICSMCGNADGSDILLPFVIGKSKKP